MKKAYLGFILILAAGGLFLLALPALSEKEKPEALPAPQLTLNVPLFKALQERHSTRDFTEREISRQDLSTILWAANGVNRKDGKRTAPTAMGKYYMEIYLANAQGVFLYEPKANKLAKISEENIKDKFLRGKDAPAYGVLIITARLNVMPAFIKRDQGLLWAHATAGCLAQNIYLAAAALGIGTRMVAMFDKEETVKGLRLDKDEEPLYIMPVGYEK